MSDKPKAKFLDVPMQAIRRHLLCDCGGEMRSAGHGMTTLETTWKHRCDKCGAEVWVQHNYPNIIHVPASKPQEK